MDLLINAIVSGVLLGGFYAALAIAFGMLDIVNIAHPVFIVLGAFLAFLAWQSYGLDPMIFRLIVLPLGFIIGSAFYRFNFYAFERRGDESLQGLPFSSEHCSSSRSG